MRSKDQKEQEQSMTPECFADRYANGLKTTVINNSVAYGYSITITAAIAVLAAGRGTPGVPEVLTFAGGALLAFTIVEVGVYLGLQHRLKEETAEVKMLGSIFSFVSIGLAVGATWVSEQLLAQLVAWPVGGLVATLVYICVQALELAVAEHVLHR
jgi:hypothetical protein